MAAKNFYWASGFAYNSDRFGTLQEGGSVTAATGVGWIPGTGHLNDYAPYQPGSTVAAASGLWTSSALPGASPQSSAPGDGWRSSSAITGQFANTDWAVKVGLRSAASNFNGRVQIRVKLWKSVNADMSSATQIGSGTATATTTANLSGSADQVLNINVSPGGITTFNNEYLYVQIACQITSNPSGATQDILWRRASASAYGVVTPDFSTGPAAIELELSATDESDTVAAAAAAAIAATMAQTDAADTLAAVAQAAIAAALAKTDDDDVLAAGVDLDITFTLAATDAADTLAATVQMRVDAALSASDDDDDATASSVIAVALQAAMTDADDQLSAAATIPPADGSIHLSAALMDAADALAAGATLRLTAHVSATDGADVLASQLAATIVSTLSATDAADTLQSLLATTISVSDLAFNPRNLVSGDPRRFYVAGSGGYRVAAEGRRFYVQ